VVLALARLVAGEPVTRIALDFGYDSPAAFSTMFRRIWARHRPSGGGGELGKSKNRLIRAENNCTKTQYIFNQHSRARSTPWPLKR
jgi:hypothetical protein